jgi:two-component system, chemotaxis family, chemotaxis protein CheY
MAKILVVDDIDYLRKSIINILNREGHEILEASNGDEAENIIKNDKPDLLIIDVVMPKKGGIELLMDLKSILKDTKIIVMSGKVTGDSEAFITLIGQYGASRFLSKPFHKKELLDTVNILLSGN